MISEGLHTCIAVLSLKVTKVQNSNCVNNSNQANSSFSFLKLVHDIIDRSHGT